MFFRLSGRALVSASLAGIMSNRWSSHPHWDSHDDRSRGGWSYACSSSDSWWDNSTLGDNNRSGGSWRDDYHWRGGDCGYGWEGRALPPVAAPESTAVAVPRPVALVPQPAAVAVPGTQPIVADAVPPQPTAVADTTTSKVRVFDMDYFAAWGQFSEGYKQHNAALNFFASNKKTQTTHLTHQPCIWMQMVGPQLRSSTTTPRAWDGSGRTRLVGGVGTK